MREQAILYHTTLTTSVDCGYEMWLADVISPEPRCHQSMPINTNLSHKSSPLNSGYHFYISWWKIRVHNVWSESLSLFDVWAQKNILLQIFFNHLEQTFSRVINEKAIWQSGYICITIDMRVKIFARETTAGCCITGPTARNLSLWGVLCIKIENIFKPTCM